MPNPNNVALAVELLRERPDLALESPISAFIGDDPSTMRLTEAALALARPAILLPFIDALIQDPSGTTFEGNPAFVQVAEREDGQIESLHALTLAKGDDWDARLHVWMEGKNFTGDPHTHRRAFGSATIAGAFSDELLVRARPGEGRRMVEWRSDQAEPLGEVALRSVKQRILTVGQHHTMPHRLIHSAHTFAESLSATVVVRRDSSPISYDFTDGPPSTIPPRVEPIDGLDTLRRLRSVLKDA